MKKAGAAVVILAACLTGILSPLSLRAQDNVPFYLKDRGAGIPTSMFGTFIEKGEWVVYPFFEYYLDNSYEYSPDEFGYVLDQDFFGRYRASEGLFFIGYGLTDRLVFEIEAAMIHASLDSSPDDPTAMPDNITESGLGDMQIQLDWMWSKETERRPGFFSYGEVVFPHHKTKYLIGTPDVETKAGIGLIKGFDWGTLIVRAAVEQAGGHFDLGEYAVEWYKRLSGGLGLYAGIEGTQDELEFITEVQWWLNDFIRFKFNNAFGVTKKATGWAPEVGIMISFKRR